MAKYGIDATQMSAPATGAAGFISKPVAETSGVELLSSALGQIPDIMTGSNLSKLDTEIKGLADEYTLRSNAEEVLAQKAGQEKAISAMWDTFDTVDMDQVNAMETSMRSDLDRYTKAYKQGVMSSDELIARVNTATRSAIARQPGLARELISQAELYKEIAGVSDMITTQQKLEQASVKERNKAIEDENKMLIKWGYNPNVLPPDQRDAIVAEAFRQERDANLMDTFLKGANTLKARGELKAQMVDQAVLSPESTAARTAHLQLISNTVSNNLMSGAYKTTYKERTRSPVEAELLGITEEFATQRSQLQTIANMGSDKSRMVLEGQIKQLDELEKLYKDVAMGGSTAQAAQHQLDAKKAAAKIPFVTLEQQLDIAQKLSSVYANLAQTSMQVPDPRVMQPLINGITESIQNFTGGLGPAPIGEIDYGTKDGKIQSAYIFSSADPENHPIMSPEEVLAHNDRNMMGNLRQFKAVADPVKFNQAFDSWMTTVVQESSRTGKPISERYSPATVVEVNKFLGDAMNNARSSGRLSYNKAANSFVVINQDGTQNPAQTKRVNTMFKGYLSFNGYTADTRIDEAGEIISNLANLRPASEILKEGNKGPVKPGQLSQEQLQSIGINPTQTQSAGRTSPLAPDMQITPEMQAERDATRVRVLQMELDEYNQKAQAETDPTKKKLYEDNIKFVTEELKQLGVAQ